MNPSETTPLVVDMNNNNNNNNGTITKKQKNEEETTDKKNLTIEDNIHDSAHGSFEDVEPTWSEVMEKVVPYIQPNDAYHTLCAIGALISVVIGKILGVLPPLAIRYAVNAISQQFHGNGNGENEIDGGNNNNEDGDDDDDDLFHLFQPVLYAILVYFILQILITFNNSIQDLAQRAVALDAERRFAVATFAHLHTLSLSYHLEKHIGEITQIMNRGSDSMGSIISSFLFFIAPTILETFVVSAVFWKLGTPTIALSTIASVIVYLTFTVLVTKTRIAFRRKLIDANDKVAQKETETLVNYETVAMFGRTRYEINQYSELRTDYKSKRMEMLSLFAILEFGQKIIRLSGTCAGLIIAGMATVYGYGPPDDRQLLSPGSFVVIQIYIDQLFQPLAQLGWQYRMIVQAFTDLEKAVTMLNRQSEVKDSPNAMEWVKPTNEGEATSSVEIIFKDVSFQYKMDSRHRALGTAVHDMGSGRRGVGRHGMRRGRAALGFVDEGADKKAKKKNEEKNNKLNGSEDDNDDDEEFTKKTVRLGGVKNINFTVPAGKTAALVGASGSGKTTLVRLLLRMYDPDMGSVEIDGTNVKDYTLESLRHNLGVVAQDTILFNASLRDNIIYGKEDATEEEIWEAVKSAALESFVQNLPDKLDTLVGDRGMKLSGGERQRVGLARCIIKNPQVILLDEATSALDSATERHIQQSIAKVCKGRTTLMIAHRLSTACRADEIIVLDQGSIIEQGSHEELLSRNGKYAAMWRLQTEQVE